MNRENILKVADAIAAGSIPDLGFNMEYSIVSRRLNPEEIPDRGGHNCGSVACIAGWTWKLFDLEASFPIAGNHLGLDVEQREALFFGRDVETDTRMVRLERISAPAAVSCLRYLAETGEVDWQRAIANSRATSPNGEQAQ